MVTQRRILVAEGRIRKGSALTVARVLKADSEGQTFAIRVMTPADPIWPVGPLGRAGEDYADGEILLDQTIEKIDWPRSPSVPWDHPVTGTPIADIIKIRSSAVLREDQE